MTSRYGLEIRGASAGDATGLVELLASCGFEVAAAALAGRLEATRRAPGAVLIALEWGPPSGVVVATWRPSLLTDASAAQLELLLVDPQARRRGIGRELLKAASRAARAAGCDTIALVADDPAMAAFALATGFTPAGERLVRPLRKRG